MSFLDQLGKKVSDAGKGVAQQTKNLTEIARLTSVIDTEEKMVAQSYTQIGKTYYENHKNDPDAECAAQIALVNKSLEKIAQWREQIQRIKGIVKCPQCGAEIPYGSQFCGVCGTKIVRPEAAPAAASVRRCPSCGAEAAASDRFCNKCGKPLPQMAPAPVCPQPAPAAPAPSAVSGNSFGYSAPVQPNAQYAPAAPAVPDIPLPVEEPVISETPVSVEEPVVPEVPASVEEAVVPEAPVSVEEPVISETPVSVEEPVVPEVPVSVEEPAAPETPVFAEEPVVPEVPASVEETVVPETSAAPDVLPLRPRFCPNCGAEADEHDRFCNRCGQSLA